MGYRIAATDTGPGIARRLAREFLINGRAYEYDDVLLVLSELVTNAVAATPDDGFIEICLILGTDCVALFVTDYSNEAPKTVLASDDAESGRGIAIINSLSICWDYLLLEQGKIVWAMVSVKTRMAPCVTRRQLPSQIGNAICHAYRLSNRQS